MLPRLVVRVGARDPAHLARLLRLCVRGTFCWSRSPRPAAFPPPPPPPARGRCSAASQVLRRPSDFPPSFIEGFPTERSPTARRQPTCHPANHQGRGASSATATGDRGISRFSRSELPRMHGVIDRAGSADSSRKRCRRCCLPRFVTTSAPRSHGFRGSIAQPTSTPANASPTPSRTPTHDSGLPWVANSFGVGLSHPLLRSGLSGRSTNTCSHSVRTEPRIEPRSIPPRESRTPCYRRERVAC